jgi:small subunit ribosomal protein S16
MVKIRLSRGGTKNAPFYKIVAIDEQRKIGGKPLQVLGYWHPAKDIIKLDKKAVKSWLDKGAVITPAVKKLIK